MTFEHDLFISYSHRDNAPIIGAEGWVTRFHKALQALLDMRMKRKAIIWRDLKLNGNDIFAAEIEARLPGAAVLLSIVSPAYVGSEWCKREATAFCAAAEETVGLRLGNRTRLFKVIKLPVPLDEQEPPVMREMTGLDFYVEWGERKTAIELDPVTNATSIPEYVGRLSDLAEQLKQLLLELNAAEPGYGGDLVARKGDKPTVYLAECSHDLDDARRKLRAELSKRGYTVVPGRELPREEDAYRAQVERLLEESDLSVHLVGSSLGAMPNGPSQKTGAMIQNELAARRSKTAQLRRVIWLPADSNPASLQQQQFVEALHGDADAQFGADLITADFEGLKTTISRTLTLIEAPNPSQPAAPDDDGKPLVYLICHTRDRDAKTTIPLRRFLKARGIDVAIPAFEGDAETIRRTNLEQLAQCDAVVVFYGAGDELWKRAVDGDLSKASASRREKRLPGQFTYLAADRTAHKSDILALDDDDGSLIDNVGGFSEAALERFIRTVLGA